MGVVVGIAVLGALSWATYARYIRVLAKKRYATRRLGQPDLSRFGGDLESNDPQMFNLHLDDAKGGRWQEGGKGT